MNEARTMSCARCNQVQIAGYEKKKIPAWFAARSVAIGRHSGGGADALANPANARIGGGVYLFQNQVQALLDRVMARWQSLRSDWARYAAAAPERADFERQFEAWNRFYQSAYRDRLAWGTNVDQAEAYDRELDAWAERFKAQTSRDTTNPTTSVSASNPTNPAAAFGSALGGALLPLGLIGGAAAILYLNSR